MHVIHGRRWKPMQSRDVKSACVKHLLKIIHFARFISAESGRWPCHLLPRTRIKKKERWRVYIFPWKTALILPLLSTKLIPCSLNASDCDWLHLMIHIFCQTAPSFRNCLISFPLCRFSTKMNPFSEKSQRKRRLLLATGEPVAQDFSLPDILHTMGQYHSRGEAKVIN